MEAALLIGKARSRINIRDCYKAWPSRHFTLSERVNYIDKVYKELEIDQLLRLSSRYSTVGATLSRQESSIVINPIRTKDPMSNPNIIPFELEMNDGTSLINENLKPADYVPEELQKMLDEHKIKI
mmetsp:Transcript_10744/g.20989  ORF Transcript_10744/g.20989 Transcript_10744/m.20989 type:complete len:126 (+) Transcript_10744:976-1353(+)